MSRIHRLASSIIRLGLLAVSLTATGGGDFPRFI